MIEVNWLLFVAASLVLIMMPGQDMVLVMSRSIAHGAVAGVATATGVCSGLVGPIGLGAAALSTWLRSHPQSLAWLFRGSGAVLLGLGLQLTLQRPL